MNLLVIEVHYLLDLRVSAQTKIYYVLKWIIYSPVTDG